VCSASLQLLLKFLVCFSKTDAEEIENLERHESSVIAVMHLFQYLPLHKENWFEVFVKALQDAKFVHALALIEPLLVEAGKLLCRS
jgi:hypothetical protein